MDPIEAGLCLAEPLLIFVGLSGIGDSATENQSRKLLGKQCELLGKQCDLEDAFDTATEAIEANPNDTQAHFQRAVICQTAGMYEHALADFAEVIRRERNHARAWLLTSEVLVKLSEYGRAKQAREHALSLDPSLR